MSDPAMLLKEMMYGDADSKRQAKHQLDVSSHETVRLLVDAVENSDEQMIDTVLEGFEWEEGEGGQKYDFSLVNDAVEENFWYIVAISDLLKDLGASAVVLLQQSLNSFKPLVRAWAAYLLGLIGDQTSIPLLQSRLNTESYEELRSVIKALGKLRAVDAVETLISLLENDEAAGTAAEALGQIGDLRAVMPLITLLKKHTPVVYSASAALYNFGEHAVLPLIQVLADEQASQVHDLVLTELWMFDDKRAIEPILALLQKTQNVKVKNAAIVALGYLKADTAIEQIREVLNTPTQTDLIHSAAMSLGNIGGEEAFNALMYAFDHGTPEVRHNAALAFGQMESVRDIQPLLGALKHSDHYIRSAIAVSLGNLKDKRAIPALREALDDSDEATRQFAASALEKIEQASAEQTDR
jgi:HEAT repeat protein